MGSSRRFKKRAPLCRGRIFLMRSALDAESFRDMIGVALYERVMQWNDSGAAEAFQVAEQRRKAKEIKRPCWLPKLNDDLYIGTVSWNTKESEELCIMPKSAVEFADKTCGEPCDTLVSLLPSEPVQRDQDYAAVHMKEFSGTTLYDRGAGLEASIDASLMVEAVLEHCPDGPRLLVGGWPVEPSGWDEVDSEFLDGPCIVEAVLEDIGDGQRLLVGGWPVQPSWDELDTNWSQLGWDKHSAKANCWEHTHADSYWKGHGACFSGHQSQWQGYWYPGNVGNSLHQGRHFTTAF